jgi:hypothetical protein
VAFVRIAGGLLVVLAVAAMLDIHAIRNHCWWRAEASWTLQGTTSLLDCPGQHPWYDNISPDARFFMGCR